MIKLIASDMDGTLVSSNHRISPVNAGAIKEAQDKGIEFIITTGRSFEDAHGQVEEAGISCNYLVMNGSELRNHRGEIIFKYYLENDLAASIVENLLAQELYVEVYTNAGTFSLGSEEVCKRAIAAKINNFHKEISLEEAYQSVEDHFLYKNLQRIEQLDSLFEQGYEIGKIISFSSDREKMAYLRTEIPNQYPVYATGSFAINLEITSPRANKGKAIMSYARSKGINLEDIMVIGDSYNDMSMLEAPFGYTVAMGNALPEIKQVAKYTTDTNDQDGVGRIIRRFI